MKRNYRFKIFYHHLCHKRWHIPFHNFVFEIELNAKPIFGIAIKNLILPNRIYFVGINLIKLDPQNSQTSVRFQKTTDQIYDSPHCMWTPCPHTAKLFNSTIIHFGGGWKFESIMSRLLGTIKNAERYFRREGIFRFSGSYWFMIATSHFDLISWH